MLLDLLLNINKNPTATVIGILLMIPCLLISLTVHEYAHGRMALALGDKTALMMGRLSLNPMHHIDPVGALMLLLFGFGFAKPVPVNLRNVSRVNYKTGTILISVAGPLSNLILALLGVFGYCLTIEFTKSVITPNNINFVFICILFFEYFSLMNIGLAIFNLIPIPPLDGSRILSVFLPVKAQMWLHRNENIIRIIIIVLLFTNVLDRFLIGFRTVIFNGMIYLISLLPFIS